MFAITRLIFKKMDEHNISMFELVQKLGYRDIDRGLKEIGLILKHGEYKEELMNNIMSIIKATQDELKAAYIKTVKEKNKANIMKYKKQQGMVPARSSLFVKLKKDESGGHRNAHYYKRIAVPDSLVDLEWIKQVRKVRDMVQEHYAANYRRALDHGYTIEGYLFYKYQDGKVYEKLYYDKLGTLKKVSTPDFPKVITALSVNREKNRLSLA